MSRTADKTASIALAIAADPLPDNGLPVATGLMTGESDALPAIVGNRYGRLVVLAMDAGKGIQGARWRCRCDCGHEVTARGKDIVLGNTTSCGCLKEFGLGKAQRQVMPGDRFTRLTVLYDTGERRAGQKVMLCDCDCGRQTRVRKPLLTNGQTKSCGCLRSRRELPA